MWLGSASHGVGQKLRPLLSRLSGCTLNTLEEILITQPWVYLLKMQPSFLIVFVFKNTFSVPEIDCTKWEFNATDKLTLFEYTEIFLLLDKLISNSKNSSV